MLAVSLTVREGEGRGGGRGGRHAELCHKLRNVDEQPEGWSVDCDQSTSLVLPARLMVLQQTAELRLRRPTSSPQTEEEVLHLRLGASDK